MIKRIAIFFSPVILFVVLMFLGEHVHYWFKGAALFLLVAAILTVIGLFFAALIRAIKEYKN